MQIRSRVHGVKTVLLDPKDENAVLAAGPWHVLLVNKVYYVRRCWREDGKFIQQYLHNFLMGRKGIDHINGDGLDNRRDNLRALTHAQNRQNSRLNSNSRSGVRGVYWYAARGCWRAHAMVNGKTHYGGDFRELADAAEAVAALRSRLMPYSNEARQ